MHVRSLSIALGCEVVEAGSGAASATSNGTSQQQQQQLEAIASESWEDFERRCRSRTVTSANIKKGEFEEMIAAFRDDITLPRTTIVWKKGDGLSRERLVLIRSCARLGRAEIVEGLLLFNFESSPLCEEIFLDALRGDQFTVISALLASNLFKPAAGFLGYALAECGSARSASCASLLFDDERCKVEALQQCNHERFGHPPWIYLRVLEDAITKAVHAGATDENSRSRSDSGSTLGRGQECLQVLACYGKSHLQDGEWERILRQAMVLGAEDPVCAVLRACPRLLVQAERLHFAARSQGASAQQILGFVIYEKGIEDQVDIVSPMDVGGLKSEEYLKMNPHGKMPCLNSPECGPIPESETICHYLLDKFEGTGRSFRPSTLEERVKSAAICRLMDTYIHPIQGCMYKASPPFGIHTDRLAALEDLQAQLAILEGLASSAGPFLAGGEVSLADATVWPTMTFIREMMPRFSKTEGDFLGPRLMAWCHHMEQHPVGKRIAEEMKAPLDKWASSGRWDGILHAGKRDEDPASIFDKILAKEIPSTVVFEDDKVLAFRDIAPVAPTHVLIIPKTRNGLTQLRHATADHADVLGHMLVVAARIAKEEELEGFRVAINDGAKGGQEVFHLHVHLIGGGTGMKKLGGMA